ncbi:MAG TPA: hypothetical protein VKV73_16095 [Chloroflexota bacterium]|nr:hypothetical protein [Chloroflexota bacterium]
MTDIQDTPSIVDLDITRFRGGQVLRYADLTGEEKRDYLFDTGIRATAYANGLPDVHLGLFAGAEAVGASVVHNLLRDTVTRISDELETPKHKLFHSFGTTAKIRFTPESSTPYTGIFQELAHGLARFSYAGPVDLIGIVPGLGLKFPVDGDRPSANVVVMRMLDPQSVHSVFHNPFTNILPPPSPLNVTMKLVNEYFETVVTDGHGLHQPVDNFARIRVSGLPVDAPPTAPYRLILVPTDAARNASDPRLDFRDDLAANLPAETTIYTVYSLDEPEERALNVRSVDELIPHARTIGAITTESEFIASTYGDYRLFFKHSDVYLRPER